MLHKSFLVFVVVLSIISSATGVFTPLELCSADLNSCIIDCNSWGKLDLRKALLKKHIYNYDFAAENGVVFVDTKCGVMPDHFFEVLYDENKDSDYPLEWQIGSLYGEFALSVAFPCSLEEYMLGDPATAMDTTYNLLCRPEKVEKGTTILDAQAEGMSGKIIKEASL